MKLRFAIFLIFAACYLHVPPAPAPIPEPLPPAPIETPAPVPVPAPIEPPAPAPQSIPNLDTSDLPDAPERPCVNRDRADWLAPSNEVLRAWMIQHRDYLRAKFAANELHYGRSPEWPFPYRIPDWDAFPVAIVRPCDFTVDGATWFDGKEWHHATTAARGVTQRTRGRIVVSDSAGTEVRLRALVWWEETNWFMFAAGRKDLLDHNLGTSIKPNHTWDDPVGTYPDNPPVPVSDAVPPKRRAVK